MSEENKPTEMETPPEDQSRRRHLLWWIGTVVAALFSIFPWQAASARRGNWRRKPKTRSKSECKKRGYRGKQCKKYKKEADRYNKRNKNKRGKTRSKRDCKKRGYRGSGCKKYRKRK